MSWRSLSRHRDGATRALAGAMLVGLLAGPAFATDIETVVSPGGVEAWLVEERAIPIISIQIGFRGGSALESAEEAGLAKLFAGMLEEGAGPYDAAGFAQRAEELAARLSFSASQDQISVSATMLAENRDETIRLLRLALVEARFDAAPLARVKAQIQSQIQQREVEPDSIAALRWYGAMFPDDVYGRPSLGYSETISAITAEDLHGAKARFLNRDSMKVGVVGAISTEELGPILDTLLGDLSDAPVDFPAPVEAAAKSGVDVVEFDAPQSEVLFGHAGPLRDDPDFIPAYVMNYILGGGGFASRLTIEVREKRGLAYGVYSYLSPYDRAGLYLGGVATANERVAESIEVIRAEWARLASEGVSEDELAKAKTYLTGAYPLRFDSNSKIAGFLVGAQMEDLGIDYINTRNDMVEAVTLDDIERVAAKWLRPEDLYFVVVGKPEKLASQSN